MDDSGRKNAVGRRGECLAQKHLQDNHYAILTTNWRCAVGELDIIAQEGETIVFVEVRTRRANTTQWAFASVNAHKQEKLAQLAHTYLHEHDLEDRPWRIDVIAIALPHNGNPIIDHAQNALNW